MQEPAASSFANLLRSFRAGAGLSQEELAERAGLTPHAVSALERGARTRPYPHTVRSLADALALDPQSRATLIAAVPSRARRPDAAAAPEPTATLVTPARASVSLTPALELGLPHTALLGREADVAAVVALVGSGARFVTLTGAGGVGKSRLVAAVAERLAPDHPDGVVSLPLASTMQASAVIPALAQRLGIPGGDGPDVLDAVAHHLGGQRLLLVLDNLEHLLPVGTDLVHLLGAAPQLTLLTTSRSPLRVRGEQEYAVEPLTLPAAGVRTEDDLAAAPAGALALQRARAVNPRREFSEDDVSCLGELCRRLAGLPLAIELASAHLRTVSPRLLLERHDALSPAAAARDLPARQRTMRATLDWSYGLLAPDEQRMFRSLGVFRGGAALEVIEEVAGSQALAVLSQLVEHSLVFVRADSSGDLRFVLLEPVAQYARSLLVGAESDAVHAAHAHYYLRLAERAGAEYEREGQVAWLERISGEEANVLVALDWALAAGSVQHIETGARIAWVMWLYWWLRGHVVLGRRKAEAALAAVESTDLPVGIRGRARLAAATMSYACGDAVTAAAHWDAALAHAQAVADPELAAKAWAGTGLAALEEGDLRTAEQRFAASIASGPDPDGRTWVESLSRIWLGTCLLLRAEYAAARESVRAGMLMARDRGDRLTIYVGLYNLAQAALADSNLAEARTHLNEGITLSEQTGDRSNLAYFVEALAVVEAAQRRPERAAALLGTSRSLRDSVGANVYGYYRPDVVLIAEAAERARTELGSAEYDAQVDRGRRMSLGEAVRLALSG